MASGINKKIHQPATCNGSSKTSHPCSSSDDCDQEMHMKMCKKIAQLTKVIYALNTKNDEYEASMQALKEAHQEEIQHILAETQETVLQYQNKVEEAQELQNYIQFLEEALKKHRQRKEEVSSEVTPCKKQIDEEELQIEAEQADDKLFQEMACTKLRVQASNKMSDGLVNKHVLFSGDTLNNKGKLTEMYSLDIQAVISETMNLKWENQKLAEEFAKKASQLETSHEREKENWRKAMQQSATDLCREWQQREMEQRKNYEAQEAASREQIGKLEADLEAKGQQINELKKYSQKLKDKLQDLETQLKEAQQMATESKSVRKTLEEECRVTKERLLLRENEILHKTEAMETVLNPHSKARSEVGAPKTQFVPLPQTQSTQQSQGNRGGGGSQPRERASLEEKSIKQQHKEGMHKIKHESAEENIHLKEQLVKGLEDLVKKHTLEIKSVQASMDAERKKLQKEVQIQLEELKRKYENEIRHLQKEKEAISEKLQDCSLEVLKLETFIRQIHDIPKYAEFLKSRKTYEKQQEERWGEVQFFCATSAHSVQKEQQNQEAQDAFIQERDIFKQHKEGAKGKELLTTAPGTRNEEKLRLGSGGAPTEEDGQTLASFQKEKSKEIQALQEEWYYQKTELQAQVTELKQTLEQQANTFRDALKEQDLQCSKEKEKLLQDLQDTVKQSQDMKAQLEASHQRAIKLLEKSKNQELKEAAECWKKEYNDRFKVQQESHSLEMQALEQKARKELHSELERIQKQQSSLIESLRMELSVCMTHHKEKEELKVELKNLKAIKKQQEGSYQNQIKSLKEELKEYQSEISGLKQENSLLKDMMNLLSVDVELQKETSAQLQERENQQKRSLEEDLKDKHKQELDTLKQDHRKEIQAVMSDFSSSQALLHAKIASLENELKELEEKPRKREPRLEDLHLIGCLQDKLNEKEAMIKELTEGRKLQHSLIPTTESRHNRSFSFNTNPTTCLTPFAKQKKKMDEAPSRIVSVPNLASYAKSFLSGDLRPKRNQPQITKSASLDQNPGCVRVCYPPAQVLETKTASRLQSNETSKPKDTPKSGPQHQEWFTKYFSF